MRATKRMMILVNEPFSDEALGNHPFLDLRNIGTAAWPRLLKNCRAHELSLYHITLKSPDGIESLGETRELTLEWATKIARLDPVFRLSHLTKLSVYDFPKLRALTNVEQLHELTELNLSGSRGAIDPPLRLTTIDPVKRIPNLISFSLGNARIDDDDITCLADCAKLRYLYLSKNFDRSQFAFLAARLNHRLETPITAQVATNLACEHCGCCKAMFFGRRMPFLCPACNEAKFEVLEREFEELINNASPLQ